MNTILREAGEALFGQQWQSDLARALGVTDRTVRRWAAGEYPMPPGAQHDLWRLCSERLRDLQSVLVKLERKP